MHNVSSQKFKDMSYVELMAFLDEVNRPPGGKESIRQIVQTCFIVKDSRVLDIGCNTGYCSFEIAHLAKCRVVGIDISPAMINAAKKFQHEDPLGKLIEFKVGDVMNLPFKNNVFDVVISGGSTAFINDKKKALTECKRVVKPWGFIADINFFYKTRPPSNLLRKLNNLMDINIQPWNINYWLNLYDGCNLERYFIYTNKVRRVNKAEIKNYCSEMIKKKKLSESNKKELLKRLFSIMSLFNQNHKYLAYSVSILRKRPIEEQISLFGA